MSDTPKITIDSLLAQQPMYTSPAVDRLIDAQHAAWERYLSGNGRVVFEVADLRGPTDAA